MEIDWFTVIAQVLNFIILVWLLKRFLYKPILNAIAEREKKIKDQLKDAEDKKAEANLERDQFIQKNENFAKEKNEMMHKAIIESNLERDRLLKEAKEDANTMRSKQALALAELQNKLLEDYEKNVQREVFSISKKTLAELASIEFEDEAVKTFVKRLKGINEKEKKQLAHAFQSADQQIMVHSGFEVKSELKKKIKNALDEILGTETRLQFTLKPELIGGIELFANGYKLGWSISEYLTSLERSIAADLETDKEPGAEKA